jgi:hypothetical protein
MLIGIHLNCEGELRLDAQRNGGPNHSSKPANSDKSLDPAGRSPGSSRQPAISGAPRVTWSEKWIYTACTEVELHWMP